MGNTTYHTNLVIAAGLAGLLWLCPACNQGEQATGSGSSTATASASADAIPAPPEAATAAPVLVNAEAVYVSAKCQMCHGASREGTKLGPPLAGLDAYWTPDKLVEYLRDPGAYAPADERLAKQAQQYPSMMPPVKLDDELLRALAGWLIAGA